MASRAGLATGIVAALCAAAAPASAQPGTLLVALEGGAPAAAAGVPPGARLLASEPRTYAFGAADVAAAVARLARAPGVLAAQADRPLTAAAPDGQCTDRPPSPVGYNLAAVRAESVAVPRTTPPIGIVDGGIADGAPEFSGRIRSPFNVLSGGDDVVDSLGHGTRVASVAAASAGGVRGVSPSSPIIPVKALDSRGEATVADVVQGIDAAVSRGAKVINVSTAGPADLSSPAEDRVLMLAINRALAAGALVVAPVGNEGDASFNVPAAYPHVIGVAATDESDRRAAFSNRNGSVDLAAPGVNIVAVEPAFRCESGYAFAEGTSFAAPAVAAADVLLQQARPGLSPSQRFSQLVATARDVGPAGRDDETGAGVLDVARALSAPPPRDDGAEPDDDVFWLKGRYARAHPAVVGPRRRTASLRGSLHSFNDPSDVYPLRLAKGDTVVVTLTGARGSRFALGLWTPATRGLDITERKTRGLLSYNDRRGPVERLRARIKRSGTYHLSVEAPNADGPDPTYSLRVSRR